MIKICAICGKSFEVDDMDRNRFVRKYCSDECTAQAAYIRKRNYRLNGKKGMTNVKCEVCGKIFLTAYVRQVTCSMECKYERTKMLARENDRQRREAIRNGTHPSLRKKAKQKKVATVEEIQREAREAGMSYGQYMARLYMQEGRT